MSTYPTTTQACFESVPLCKLSPEALEKLSKQRKLGLSKQDMQEVQKYFVEAEREPTDVELEVIAQTWSEHCKHRIFGAKIVHKVNGKEEEVDGLFRTFVKEPSEEIFAAKPGFVLSAFHDNAGFIALDENLAVCLKAETHNHPSALEPYAGANTGLGGVIRDILGAGIVAKPIANLDVFCFGPPDLDPAEIKAEDVIHPLGILRGVVRGVRDYGNRMGIPTVNGALQFAADYTYNPLVFCGTAGVIDRKRIDKQVEAGMLVLAVGGRTGRDGLKGATFSSATLTADSHTEDQSAVQIGNPIEEKKVAEMLLAAAEEGLIGFVTDCGAGGFSSAAGEMLSEIGGTIWLERCPLKTEGLASWEVFVSESQERMVLAANPEHLERLVQLAKRYETEAVVIGEADGSGVLKVKHHEELVVELDNSRLHEAPRLELQSSWKDPVTRADHSWPEQNLTQELTELLAHFQVCSRAPIIREYDHEVQGNTILKPLAGASGSAPQDGAVVRIDGSDAKLAIGCAILPEWGRLNPQTMGAAVVDECVRSLILVGSKPEEIAILDNFCLGDPNEEKELGALVETCKGMAKAARVFGAPFVSGKDSFYNSFETEEGVVSIPCTLLVSGMGVVRDKNVTGSTLRRGDSVLVLVGNQGNGAMGASVFAQKHGVEDAPLPEVLLEENFATYKAYAAARSAGLVLSAHDCSEGGLAVCLSEMGFGLEYGMEVTLAENSSDAKKGHAAAVELFHEAPGRMVLEVAPENLDALQEAFSELPLQVLGRTTSQHQKLVISSQQQTMIDAELSDLFAAWQNSLRRFY